jgi:hypothetical protein
LFEVGGAEMSSDRPCNDAENRVANHAETP